MRAAEPHKCYAFQLSRGVSSIESVTATSKMIMNIFNIERTECTVEQGRREINNDEGWSCRLATQSKLAEDTIEI